LAMADGRFAKLIGTIEGHPVYGLISLASTMSFAGYGVSAVVRYATDIGLGYVLGISISAGCLVGSMGLLYYESVRPPPLPPLPDPPPPRPTSPSLVIDDRFSVVEWEDDPEGGHLFATCRVHVTNQTGAPIRLVKVRLVNADVPGTIRELDRNWLSDHGSYVDDNGFVTIECKFHYLAENVKYRYEDEVEFTDSAGVPHSKPVRFERIYSDNEPV